MKTCCGEGQRWGGFINTAHSHALTPTIAIKLSHTPSSETHFHQGSLHHLLVPAGKHVHLKFV